VDTNRVDLVFPDGRIEKLPLMSKDAVARRIVRRIGDLVRIADSGRTAGFNRINP
jgi:phosphopantothenoylcysteine synthetase/decarboxylase